MISRHGSRMKRHRKDIWTASVINAGVCSFQIFRHNKDEAHDWSFLNESLKDCKVQDPQLLEKGLKDPIKDSEMQKIIDHYLKNNKTSGRTLSRQNSSKRYRQDN
jgi:hypothetical protein